MLKIEKKLKFKQAPKAGRCASYTNADYCYTLHNFAIVPAELTTAVTRRPNRNQAWEPYETFCTLS